MFALVYLAPSLSQLGSGATKQELPTTVCAFRVFLSREEVTVSSVVDSRRLVHVHARRFLHHFSDKKNKVPRGARTREIDLIQ